MTPSDHEITCSVDLRGRDARLLESAAIRTLIAAPFWIARFAFSDSAYALWSNPVADALLVSLHLWAVYPIKVLQGPDFPSPRYISSNVVTPLLIAVVLLLRDLLAVVR